MSETRVIHVNDMRNYSGSDRIVYIGRAFPRRGLAESKWANPYRIGEHGTRIQVIALYAEDLRRNPELIRQIPEVRGKLIACWCRREGERQTNDNRCHGDILTEWLEDYADEELRSWEPGSA